jgi:hypothetical protein
MTGTVTGVTGYQWYAGGQWRVMSQIVRRFMAQIVRRFGAPYRCASGVGRPGSGRLTDFSVIAWINATSGERQFRF